MKRGGRNLKVNSVPYRPIKADAIDVDAHGGTTVFRMLKTYFNVLRMGKTNVRVKLSAHNGFHIYADEGFTQYEAMVLGDCKGRLTYWERQGYTFTFNRKMTWRNRTIGVEQEFNPLSLPFYSVEGRSRR